MIVKNEEKNIERALSWGKGVVCEQIVVDTGSTDRTVEMAKRMGAKVFHFPWIDDFAAAKNHAIDQAKGNWIAFLDADEYFSEKDAKNLKQILTRIDNDPYIRQNCFSLRCPCVQLDDQGQVFMLLEQERIFRNLPRIRYQGKIHEYLTLDRPSSNMPDLNIMHTGYSQSAYKEGDKAARNVSMLRGELAKNPEDPNFMCYLGDSLRIDPTQENLNEAAEHYSKALQSDRPIAPYLKQSAYNFLMLWFLSREGRREEGIELCRKAVAEFPGNPDFHFYYGNILYEDARYPEAWEQALKCEELLKAEHLSTSFHITSNPGELFFKMLKTAQRLGDQEKIIRCATLLLKEDKYQDGILTPFLRDLKSAGADVADDEIFKILERLYDMKQLKDKLFMLRCAKDAGNAGLSVMLLGSVSQEEWDWIKGGGDQPGAASAKETLEPADGPAAQPVMSQA
jgi:glycosyltransferase involved in cell wall biosynthesis